MKEILSDVTVPCHAVGSFIHQPSFASRSSPPLHWKGISVQSCPSLPLSLFCRTRVSWADTVCPVLSYKVRLNCLTIWVYSFQFSDECFKCSHSKGSPPPVLCFIQNWSGGGYADTSPQTPGSAVCAILILICDEANNGRVIRERL